MTDPYALFEAARKQGPNPFTLEPVIAAEEVWGEVISDLTSLNQHIDQKIDQAISEVRQKYLSKIGMAIKGDRGLGKSHAIHRIWKKVQREGGAVFAYIPPCKNPRRIDSHVRFYLSESFIHQDVQGVTQWQKLASSAIATLKGTEFEEEYREYLERCERPDELRKYIVSAIEKPKLLNFLESLTESILENQPKIDFYFLKAVLFTIFKSAKLAQVGLAWIKGEDNPDIKKAGLPEYSAEQQEERSVWTIQQICKLAEVASLPVMICFDQLDSVEPDSNSGDSPAQTIARCIDRIYFQCSNLIVLCCVISDTWIEIEQMGSGIPDRVGQWSVTAKPPTADQMIELVKLRLNWFYKNKNLNPDDYPFLYPLQQDQIRNIAKEAAGVRSLLEECAKKFDEVEIGGEVQGGVSENEEDKKKKKFLDTYNDLLQRIESPIKDDEKLAAIISCTIKMMAEGGNVALNKVEKFDASSHDLHFTISGYDSLHQKEVKIGVRVCETTNGHSFNAVMKRLLNYNKHKLTRGCLVRSTPLPRNWKKGKELEEQLVKQQGGEVVVMKKDEIKPLVAIERIHEQAKDYGFEQEEVVKLVKDLQLAANNPLLCEILSAP